MSGRPGWPGTTSTAAPACSKARRNAVQQVTAWRWRSSGAADQREGSIQGLME
ncbi:hypothetical protein [Fodinicurvata halophila]|uniref:hypothetical protein n=1 Tax=Fodinicurvata halophila TaxID=1419723 RepID=UPI00363A5D49